MPTKLKILLVLLLLGLGSSYLQESWFGVGFYVFCMAGLLKGHRSGSKFTPPQQLHRCPLFRCTALWAHSFVKPRNLDEDLDGEPVVRVRGRIFIYYGFSLATNCFFIYVLRDVEVQNWLLMRSLGESD